MIGNHDLEITTIVVIIFILFLFFVIKFIIHKFKSKEEKIFYITIFILFFLPVLIYIFYYFIRLNTYFFLGSIKKEHVEYITINEYKINKNKMVKLFSNRKWVHAGPEKLLRGSLITIKLKDGSQKKFTIRYELKTNLILLNFTEYGNIFIPKLYEFLKEKKIDFTRVND